MLPCRQALRTCLCPPAGLPRGLPAAPRRGCGVRLRGTCHLQQDSFEGCRGLCALEALRMSLVCCKQRVARFCQCSVYGLFNYNSEDFFGRVLTGASISRALMRQLSRLTSLPFYRPTEGSQGFLSATRVHGFDVTSQFCELRIQPVSSWGRHGGFVNF